ncbi:MAG: hypothetical protein IH614_13985, partial [Desulfuromonadales bacterium]|nr:hypothetical protein [Desulfuromonadales bacterium]
MKLLHLLTLAAALLAAGCASYTDLAPGTVLSVTDAAVLEREAVAVEAPAELPPPPEYQVGPG